MLQQDFLSKNDVGLGWLRSDTDLFEAPSKSYSSWTKEPYLFVQESKLNELIDERVSQKVNELLEQRASIIFRNITKSKAKEEISGFIKQKQEAGIFRISVLDVVLNLKLPTEQIEAIMEDYKKQKKVKEI